MKRVKIVLVEWLDAVSLDEWTDRLEPLEPVLCISAGILLLKDKHHIKIAVNYIPETDQASCVMTIPIGMVKSIKYLCKGLKF